MVNIIWVMSVVAGAICFGAGVLAWMKSPKKMASGIFLFAMASIFVAMATSGIYTHVEQSRSDLASAFAKAFVVSATLAMTLLWELTVVFPVERKLVFWPPSVLGSIMFSCIVGSVVLGLLAEVTYTDASSWTLSDETARWIVLVSVSMICLATGISLISRPDASEVGKRSSLIFLTGMYIFAASGVLYAALVLTGHATSPEIGSVPSISLVVGVGVSGFLFAVAIAEGQMVMFSPATERLLSSSKTKYKLLHKRSYLVLEPKPDFSVKMFTDILKGRCFDCEDDESFACESLDCNTCSLPCPCRECTKYKSRAQGLIVTRQFPKDLRSRYFIQTTPIIWLSTVSGKDNMDPAKLSLLTDYIVNFMEKSQNGVVLVDGLEYLVTSNDFARTLKAVDKWTETAMTSSSRIIMTADQRAFDLKEMAMLERNREVVRPDASETWRVIPERI